MLRFLTIGLLVATTAYAADKGTIAADTKHDGSSQVGKAKMAVTNIPDAEIARILMNINEGEIAQAETAKAKSSNAEVKSFADTMINDHRANIQTTQSITTDNAITPRDSAMSRELKSDIEKMRASFAKAKPAGFDKFYVNHQIEMHEKALNLLDNKLIPSAKNAQLKAHLEGTRAAVAGHLDHDRDLSKKL